MDSKSVQIVQSISRLYKFLFGTHNRGHMTDNTWTMAIAQNMMRIMFFTAWQRDNKVMCYPVSKATTVKGAHGEKKGFYSYSGISG